MRRPPRLFALLAVVTGCSTGTGGGGFFPTDGGGGGEAADLRPAAPVYPPGPYGNKIDDTLADITFKGYRLDVENTDSGSLGFEDDIKLAEYLTGAGVAPKASRKCKCLLITWGAGWCSACKQEQPALKMDIDGDPDFCVLNILQEGNAQGPLATKSDLDAWTQRYQQNFYVVLGSSYTKNLWKGHARNGVISLPFNFVVDAKTMKILDVVQGYRKDIHTYSMGLCGH